MTSNNTVWQKESKVAVKNPCPTDGNSYGLVDDALKIEEITTNNRNTQHIHAT